MKRNKNSVETQNAIAQSPRACKKLGDGGAYIGGGRLFKKSVVEPTINNEAVAEDSIAQPVDKRGNCDNAEIVNTLTFANDTKQSDESVECFEAQSSAIDFQKENQNAPLSNENEEEKKDIIVPYGDYHTHTVFSDGTGTLEENIQHAISIGLKEYAVTDHAFRHKAHGITLANFQVQKRMVELYREKYPQIKIYHALEGNIMGYSGLLDTDAYVNDLDFLQMGFHKTASNESITTWWSFTLLNLIFKPSKAKIEKNTLAYLRCIDRYPLKFVNHLNYGVLVNCKEIAKLCVERGTKIELNGKRVFFSQQDVDDMLETGVEFVVNSDAHASDKVGDVQLPIEFAKTHGIPLDRIVNLKGSIL